MRKRVCRVVWGSAVGLAGVVCAAHAQVPLPLGGASAAASSSPTDPIALAASALAGGEVTPDAAFATLDGLVPPPVGAARSTAFSRICSGAETLARTRCTNVRHEADDRCGGAARESRDPAVPESCAANLARCERERTDAAASGIAVPGDCQTQASQCIAAKDDEVAACRSNAANAAGQCAEETDVMRKRCDLRVRVARGELTEGRACFVTCAMDREARVASCRREAAAEVDEQRRERSKSERECDEAVPACLTREGDVAASGGVLYDVVPCRRYKLERRGSGGGLELRAVRAACSRARAAGSGVSNSCAYERSECRMAARVIFEAMTDSEGGGCTSVADEACGDCRAACQ